MENIQPQDNIFKVPEVPKRQPEEIAFEEEAVTQVEEYFEDEEYIDEKEELITEEEEELITEEVVPVVPVKGRLYLLPRDKQQHLLYPIWSDSGAY